MANTLAYNHLAKHGRSHPSGGPRDTAMYKTSQLGPGRGKVWHVNEDEKRLMNMYGLRGEKLVDAVGSGTINPVTGLEEKFLPALIAAAPAIALLVLLLLQRMVVLNKEECKKSLLQNN